jgi:hypothetical protein
MKLIYYLLGAANLFISMVPPFTWLNSIMVVAGVMLIATAVVLEAPNENC